jgi:hypothetical protein
MLVELDGQCLFQFFDRVLHRGDDRDQASGGDAQRRLYWCRLAQRRGLQRGEDLFDQVRVVASPAAVQHRHDSSRGQLLPQFRRRGGPPAPYALRGASSSERLALLEDRTPAARNAVDWL